MNWPTRIASVLIAILFCYGLQMVCGGLGSDKQRLVALAGLYVTLAVSLNLINGITGQFSIGHAAFYQVGAYTAGFLSIHFMKAAGVPPSLWLIGMMLVAAIAASAAGFIVGLPSLRLRGDYLAIVTLGFGEILRIIVQNTPALGGAYALDKIPAIREIWLIWLLAIICIAVCRNLLKTAHGLTFLAVREDEVASLAMGVNVTRVKVTAFMIGAAFAGAAGALLAHYETSITPGTFAMDVSFIILTMVVLGGTGSITGSALAAVTLFALPEALREVKTVSGAGFIASVIATVTAVWAIRWVIKNYHEGGNKKAMAYLGVIAGAIVLALILPYGLNLIPPIAKKSFEGAKLRMVIFAGSLIVIMLIRPQGVFAHHEFSWDWVKRVLRIKPREVPA
ncbi:MAG: branched-chain amino acid ABC transporter permease [Fimbriimonadaceae bacterium]|nr:branched-chain amino acid ABC transporter permease [Fimbriimonadaceae bacterium]